MEGRNTAEAGSRHKPAIRVAFGHQSVGEDLLQAICSQEMDDELVVRRSGLPEIHFRHRRIGANGNPESKIDDFVAWMESDAGSWAEVALFKFCYADITAETDLTELLGSQTSALRHLRGRFPETKFLQCTIPLTVNPRLIDRLIVGLRHRSPHPALLANLRRNEFNDRLRAASHSAFPLFDLAALESRGVLDASAALDRRLARDHGHLTASASKMIGIELLGSIAGCAAS